MSGRVTLLAIVVNWLSGEVEVLVELPADWTAKW